MARHEFRLRYPLSMSMNCGNLGKVPRYPVLLAQGNSRFLVGQEAARKRQEIEAKKTKTFKSGNSDNAKASEARK